MTLTEYHADQTEIALYAQRANRMACVPRRRVKHPLCRLDRYTHWPMLAERHWSLLAPRDMSSRTGRHA